LFSALSLLLVLAACGDDDTPSGDLPAAKASMQLTSSAFADGATIPKQFTCSGKEISPPLQIRDLPENTDALALIVDDPDANGYVHWSVIGIEPETSAFKTNSVPAGAVQTQNSSGKAEYAGPCPPKGDDPHRYVFTIYSLDDTLALGADASPDDVRGAINGHALAKGVLTGKFGR
jgi:Raf kinase inhibitor-like YbhB/YbcL family protein